MITYLIEMLELSNFGHMGTSTIKIESHKKFFVNNVMDRNFCTPIREQTQKNPTWIWWTEKTFAGEFQEVLFT